jgi:hypothetical protein
VLFPELIVFPRAVFGPVDFLAFLRFASIYREEDPFEELVNVCVASVLVVSDTIAWA